jgi:hypothetical protein
LTIYSLVFDKVLRAKISAPPILTHHGAALAALDNVLHA